MILMITAIISIKAIIRIMYLIEIYNIYITVYGNIYTIDAELFIITLRLLRVSHDT